MFLTAAGVIGCVDGSVAVIIAPKGDHHKAAFYPRKGHYAHIVMVVSIGLPIISSACPRSEMWLTVLYAFCDADMGILP